ncbi:MAG: hypothetical protein K1X67_17815 [Fimbriimonadaceae bacterium]|nr:hypothetical protein [Fimbriimonadaceae bacterium]
MPPIPVVYTFGNHMHWVDMQWLWGYHVLPGSVDDMLAFCKATGAKGNINFDVIGYEKLAAENPEAFGRLREAVRAGQIEIVGASYGQPYGLFHGGESNIRQRVYGVRSVEKLFGVKPVTFWEEEFDFFPQLPQILSRSGFAYGSLFFQWTWHTPIVPVEEVPAVWWTAPDGSKLLCATRNGLNLHQWPEDFDGLLDRLAQQEVSPQTPLILQWLELMPSPDWMCRSEVLLPRMKELLADPRFDIRFATLSEYLSQVQDAPVREYGMDQVFDGMSLGKNADTFRRYSAECEQKLVTAETLAFLSSLLGRPYPQWDVYPIWELEEAWRELLAAQHHDNDECEGLCGHIGKFSYDRCQQLADHVIARTLRRFSQELPPSSDGVLFFNPLPWSRSDSIDLGEGTPVVVRDIPAMGFKFVARDDLELKAMPWVRNIPPHSHEGDLREDEGRSAEGESYQGQLGDLSVEIDIPTGQMEFKSPEGTFRGPLLSISYTLDKQVIQWTYSLDRIDEVTGDLILRANDPKGAEVEIWLKLPSDQPCLDVTIKLKRMPRPDGGMNAGLWWSISMPEGIQEIIADTPYHLAPVRPEGEYQKKYPAGDWMTSPQWFEAISRPFTALSAVDLLATDRGLLVVQDRTRQWRRTESGVECLLTMYDPWDEENYDMTGTASFRLIPHGAIASSDRYRKAREFIVPVLKSTAGILPASPPSASPQTIASPDAGRMPAVRGGSCAPRNVVITALYRETTACGIEYPFIARLVEFDGIGVDAILTLPGTIAKAWKTNLLNEPTQELTVQGNQITCPIAPYEIATIVLDLVEGRKQVRDLDAKREIWATVHRVGEE